MKENEEFVVVYKTQGMLRAEVIKSKLESAGIPAMLKYESIGSVLPVTIDGLGEVKVLVHKKDEAEARAVIMPSDSTDAG